MPHDNEISREEFGIAWRIPVVVLVLTATAIPVELRPFGSGKIDYAVSTLDVLANLAAYVVVGIVLGKYGPLRAFIAATLISIVGESSQLVIMHRTPSPVDLATNMIGAALGVAFSRRWKIVSPTMKVNRWRALAASALALLLVLEMRRTSGPTPSARGVIVPGTLEAHWKFDEPSGRIVTDSSGQSLIGKLKSQPKRVGGIMGGAVELDGENDFIDFGHSTNLRLVGSMTIAAWIRPSSFPVDDAAIVSGHKDYGYQLDTTVDRGARTIGFKLTDECGELMARYGATPLVIDAWQHVAGVYSAEAKTLDVFLDGKRDNGFLSGVVTDNQRSFRRSIYIGRRSGSSKYNFSGSIDDVRIYSVALTELQIGKVMGGSEIDSSEFPSTMSPDLKHAGQTKYQPAVSNPCPTFSESGDRKIPAIAGTLGVVVAIACVGLWPYARVLACMAVSFSAGLVLLAVTPSTLPSFNLWLIPLTSLVGGASVAVALTRLRHDTHA